MAGLRSATATSAGGIVISNVGGKPSLVIGLRRRDGKGRRATWTLPKGTPDPGESMAETALREVQEESGLQVTILEALPSISYTFTQGGTKIDKTVHYWLMEPIGGDLARHDHEFQRVRWVSFEDAAHLLTFETERWLVAQAADHLPEAIVTPAHTVPPPLQETESSAT